MITPFIIYGPDYGDGFDYTENARCHCYIFVVISKIVYHVGVYNPVGIQDRVDRVVHSSPCFHDNPMIVIKTITREAIDEAISYLSNNTYFFSDIRGLSKKELLSTESNWLAHPSKIAFSSCFPSDVVSWNEILEAAR